MAYPFMLKTSWERTNYALYTKCMFVSIPLETAADGVIDETEFSPCTAGVQG